MMQSSGMKRPVAENEGEAPESLFPAKDPYPSDDEMEYENGQENRKSKFKSASDQHKTLKTNISIDTLVSTFNIRFLKLPKCETEYEEIASYGVNQVLDLFLPMLFKDVSTKHVIDFGLEFTTLQILYDVNSYVIPEDYDGIGKHELRYTLGYLKVMMGKVGKLVSSVRRYDDEMDSYLNCNVKSFFSNFLQLLGEGVAYTGASRYTFTLSLPQSSCTQQDPEIQPDGLIRITAKPDLVIGHECNPRVPIQVYSPHKHAEEEENNPSPLCPPDINKQGISYDNCEDFVSLQHFLNSNIPTFLGTIECEGMSKNELTKQLILDLLGTSRDYVNYALNRMKRKAKQEKQVFIGLLVFQFYMYILKIEAYETDVNICANAIESLSPENSLNVQFVPLPLDIRLPSHGIALLFLLKYYTRKYMC